MHGDFFKRQIELWGSETQESLAQKHVTIVGAGGLGCTLGYALGSSGIGTLEFIDHDRVEAHNIHRQIGFDFADQGEFKAKALTRKLAKRAPEFVTFKVQTCLFEEAKMSSDTDLIIDATDNFAVRKQIDRAAKNASLPWLYGSVEEFNAQVCFFEAADFGVFATKAHTPKGIAAPIVMHAASLQANLALRYLAGLEVKKDTLYYLCIDNEGIYSVKKLGMPTA